MKAAFAGSAVSRRRCVESDAVAQAQAFYPCLSRAPSERKFVMADAAQPFLSDVTTLRERARKHVADGAVSSSYVGDVAAAIDILQAVLATEIVCVLRYTQHSIVANGLASEGVKAEFAAHASEEQGHAMLVAQRISQLGGTPDFNPENLATRSAAQYATAPDLVGMITENLIAERIAVDHYRELARYFADNDPTTRRMIEQILAVEEEHATDMADLLARHRT
jgi:bacterioferritin